MVATQMPDTKQMLQEALGSSREKLKTPNPIPSDKLVVLGTQPELEAKWSGAGARLIKEGKAAVVTMAGGQGSRLGSSQPKGCYQLVLSADTKVSLFQLQADRIAALNKHTPWLVMTSPATDGDTRRFFASNGNFGCTRVSFFVQEVLPALTEDGQVILDVNNRPVLSPGGNGGIFKAMLDAGIFEQLRREGVEWVQVVGVDNVLVRPVDPLMIGCMAELGLKLIAKSVTKRNDREQAGRFVVDQHARLTVAEYTELPSRIESYGDVNIAAHCFSLGFLEECSRLRLPFHVARKSIKTGLPEPVQGIKLEQFIFDAFPEAGSDFRVMRVKREQEFSALKNAAGEDSPDTCINALLSTVC